MHAFHACDYFSDQLHEEHYRMTTRQGRAKRHAAAAAAADAEITTSNLETTETVHRKFYMKVQFLNYTSLN